MIIEVTEKIKGSIIGSFSKVSQELFKEIEKHMSINNFYYATKNKEYYISMPKNIFYLYDFCDRDNNKIIEFNGDVFHANPLLFESNDRPNPFRQNLTSEDIWKFDSIKNNVAKEKGFDVLIIWEHDYRKNPKQVIQECIDFLNK